MTKARKHSKTGAAVRASGQPAGFAEKDDSQDRVAQDGHIDQIRDILFGRQMADFDERFTQLEKQISSRIDALRQATDEGLTGMKELLQKQNDVLTERLKDEQSSREGEDKTLSVEINRVEKILLKSIETLSARQVSDVQSLGEQLSALSNQLSDELYIQQKEAAKNLETAVREIDDAKPDRTSLSQMLMELAGRLSDGKE